MRGHIKRFLMRTRLDPMYLRLRLKGVVRYDRQTRTYVREIRGNRFHLNPLDASLSRVLARDGIRERESVEALYQHIHPDMTIFDLGANIGFYVVLEAQVLSKGSGRVIAVEPEPENIRLRRLNVRANKYDKIVPILQGAVTTEGETARLQLSEASNCHRLEGLSSSPAGGPTIDVRAYTFDGVLAEAGVTIGQLDFLRMDIEGAEYQILPSIISLIEGKDSFLMFVEFHPSPGTSARHREILKSLQSMGYRCVAATKDYLDADGHVRRESRPNATIRQLYEEPFFLQPGGAEVFLKKG